MNAIVKQRMQDILKQGECEVIFTKKDNTERQMICTLHPSYLPQVDEAEGGTKKPPNDEVVTVWDIEANGWRSFRIDSVTYGPVLVG